ncbi:sulfate ABC transporter ATP-binding protein [Neosynechococcus sphagnicola sy1]|uniref:ABC-type quaternary amine transporter n=1 Tax=Neosynechococcus sphagnicola sy1 TaxID=1497020 RepID=A0A098TI67_9CYAN|nr:sulfate ABC transporter ATP-binding protein [Neosynechococcus sphagnicola]KGF71726.1 sulfate ABC transporter ATP-binding protein [Neosynechococcus sphagnicola sy1]
MTIVVENLSKQFGNFKAVDQVSLEIKPGKLVALLGASGSGKSTLLRLVAGLEQADAGRILIAGQDVTFKSVQDRGIGFVFQHYALFKHLTVRENIAFGLELQNLQQGRKKGRSKAKVEELLDLIQLQGLGNRYPSQLSGGQRQRVALARALAIEPSILLLDEPFGALDAKVRKDLRGWLHRLHTEVNVTTILVTHDQEEAMELADEIVVMNNGKVEQVGSPTEIYDQPASAFVMSFIGPVNILPSSSCLFQGNTFNAVAPKIFVRPHDVVITTQPIGAATPAKVSRLVHLGREIQAELTLSDGQNINANIRREHFDQIRLELEQQVYIQPKFAKTFSSGGR